MLGRRSDEGDVVLFENLSEAGILSQEAIARMYGVGAGDLAGGDNCRNIEIAVLGRRRADAHALIGEPHMHGVGVGRRVHRNGGDAKLLASAFDAEGDLSPVGDQDLVEHRCPGQRCSITASGSPYSTGWPSSTRIAITVPARGEGIWFMVFMASMMSSVCPAATCVPTSTKGGAPGSGER